MARMAVADGITQMACTPHITPGIYDNDGRLIAAATAKFSGLLKQAQIPLTLHVGADVHVAPDLPGKLKSGEVPTLNGSRYFLLEPSHHVVPPRIDDVVQSLIAVGFVPIITHPERLTWIRTHYDLLARLNDLGCRIQLTADSLTGGFGRTALFYARRLVSEGRVDIVASDCHSPVGRPPRLLAARGAVAEQVGASKAEEMVLHRPAAILADQPLPPVVPTRTEATVRRRRLAGVLRRIARIKDR